MELKIYTRTGAVRYTTDATRKESSRVRQLMGDNYVQIVFNHTGEVQSDPNDALSDVVKLEFKAGDNISYKGEKFTLIQDYKPEVINEYEYHFELKFEGLEGYLKTLPFFHYITDGESAGKEPEVNYTANLPMSADLIITAIREASEDTSWEVGVAVGEKSKYLNFSADSIFDALGRIAEEFNVEWWLEGKTLNFSRCVRGDLQTFSQKAGGGLSKVTMAANNEIIPNRIFAYGGTRNITKKYTTQGLAYNTRLRLPAGIEYVEATGEVENIISKTVFFDNDEVGDIYPRRVGIISKVETGGTTEAPVYYFYDKDIDFDPKAQLLEGTTMMVCFKSGLLQGRDFELGYNEKLKRFEIINTQEGEIQVPFGSIVPRIGDEYILWNMEMPPSYITNAELELKAVAQEYIDNLNKKMPEITCKSFEPYFDEYGKTVDIGSRIKIEDDRLKGGYIESRVTKFSYPLFCESQVEFTLSENVASGRLTQIENKIKDVTADNSANVQSTRAVSRRAWRDAQELASALEALSAELVLVGNPESQFSCSCVFKVNKNNDPNLLAVSAGELQHVVYKGAAGDKWIIEGAEFTLLEDTLHYVYFKCGKTANKGNIIISQVRLGLESQAGYYLFLGGVVSSIFENARIVNVVSGFTQIAGGNITTERIQDAQGRLIIDLSANPPSIVARGGAKFVGDFEFESGSGLDNIEGIDELRQSIYSADDKAQESKDYINNILPEELQYLRDQVDGVVENWFYAYTPTTTNFPTSEWATEGDRRAHVGDTFTNTQLFVDNESTPDAGKSWRWVLDGGQYKWTQIADSDAVKALLDAAKAQDTADGKRRVFLNQPTTPYDAGDMWAQGVSGDIMRCVKSRHTGSFDPADWDKAAKYTDDTVVNELMQHLADDNIITKEEKSTIRNAMSRIENEYTAYVEDAARFFVDSGNLTGAYNRLKSYLVDVVRIYQTNEGTVLTEAQKNTYNSNFSDYYIEVSRLVTAISDAIASAKMDSFQYLKDAFGNETFNISGGVALGGFVGVKNEAGNIVGGMAGRNFLSNKVIANGLKADLEIISPEPARSWPMIFCGNEGAVSNANSAKTRIYPDGRIDTKDIHADGGTIGGFTLSSDHIGAGKGNTDWRYEGLSIHNDLVQVGSKLVNEIKFAGIGPNVGSVTTDGVQSVARFEVDFENAPGAQNAPVAVVQIRAKFPSGGNLGIPRRAIWSEGNVHSTGGHRFVSDKYIGAADYSAIAEYIHITDQFVFTSSPSFRCEVNIPYLTSSAYTNKTFRINILLTRSATNGITIKPKSGTNLYGADGVAIGSWIMGPCHSLELQWCNGDWYILNYNTTFLS